MGRGSVLSMAKDARAAMDEGSIYRRSFGDAGTLCGPRGRLIQVL